MMADQYDHDHLVKKIVFDPGSSFDRFQINRFIPSFALPGEQLINFIFINENTIG
jgi:hypothetical protein